MVAQTRKRKAALAQPADPAAETPSKSSTSPKRQKLPVRSKGEEAASQNDAGRPTLITFDDDGKADKEWVAPAPTSEAVMPESENEDSDDDAAPEAVSTTKVASDIKKSSQAARKAAQELAAVEKRKRQERDALLKKQAEERKMAEQEAAAAASSLASAAQDDGDNNDDNSQSAQPALVNGRRRIGKAQIPNILPLEFLTDSSGEDSDKEMPGADGSSRPRKRKVAAVERSLMRLDRGPRDELVGSTVFRVAKKQDDRLAPKANKYSRGRKDMLIKRNRTAAAPQGDFFSRVTK